MSKITSTHDKFVRAILADKSIAVDYFANYLPDYISNTLDFSSLTQLSDTYLSKQLQKTMSDIVYSCEQKNGKNVRICLLIEHKSHPDKFTPVQIGSYIFSGLQKQIDSKERLSVIVPILFYHGHQKWKYRTLLDLFGGIESEWGKFIPDFDFVYNNLGEIPDKDVETINNKFLTASLLALKHSFKKDWLEENVFKILVLTQDANENLQDSLVVYLFSNSKLEENKIIELLEPLPSNLKTKIMSTLDIFVKKGRLEGVQETQVKIISNLIKTSSLSDSQIASAVDVSIDFVQKIRAGLHFN